MLLPLLVLPLAACDSGDPGSGSGGPSEALTFAPVGLPIRDAANNVFTLVEARGKTVFTNRNVSRDGGETWRRLNPQIGTLGGLVFESETAVFLNTSGAGLARYDLAADVITPLPRPAGVLPVASAYRPRDGTLFSVQGSGIPVYRYRAGTWTSTPFPAGGGTGMLGFGADEASGLYVLTTDRKLLVSANDGATWTVRTHPFTPGTPALAVLPGGTLLLYEPLGKILDRSTDGGQTWQRLTPPLSGTFSLGPLRVTAAGEVYLRNFRSTDGGQTWASVLDGDALNAPAFDLLVPSGTGTLYLHGAARGFFRAPVPATRLEFAGGFAEAETAQTTGAALSLATAVHLADGAAVTRNARYDPALRQWLWTGVDGVVRRLPGGRIGAHGNGTVRVSSDGGRTWTAPVVVQPTAPSDNFRHRLAYGVFGLSDGRLVAASQWEHVRTGETLQRLHTSRDGGQTWTLTREGANGALPLVAAVDGTTVFTVGFLSRDGGTVTGEDWEARVPVASLPGGGVLFVSPDAPTVLKRWKNNRESTVGTVEGLAGTDLRQLFWMADVDEAGYAYVACGRPLVQFCKSSRPVN